MEIRDHALLFALTAKACIQYLGEEEGRKLAERITVSYGHKRGRRMRLLAEENGEPADMNTFLVHGEWQGREDENQSSMRCDETSTELTVTKCAWADTWKRYRLVEYGKIYCLHIDRAIAEGFSGGFELKTDGTIADGSEECRFIWTAGSDQETAAREKEKADGRWILPFEYHCRELLETASGFLPQEIMEEIRYEYHALLNREAQS